MIKNQYNIEITNLSLGYHRKPILTNINATASLGELIVLIGRNGSGKSTLIKALVNLLPPLSGDIKLLQKSIRAFDASSLSSVVGYVSSEPVRVPHLTIYDLVALGRYRFTGWMGKLKDDDHVAVKKAIELTGIAHLSEKYINEVSDGEKQKAMLARVVAQDNPIIVLDEPTAFLDVPGRYDIIKLLSHLCTQCNKTIIFSSHDLDLALTYAHTIWCMNNASILSLTPIEFKQRNVINEMFGKV
jgi:iron complex transport system ATP-binding protein